MMTSEQGQVTFGRSTIDFHIERSSRRKTVTIAVDPAAGVILKAPTDVPAESLGDVVSAKGAWILQRLMEHRELGPAPAPREYVSGETCLYLGRHYRLKVTRNGDADRPRAVMRGGFIVTEIPANVSDEDRPATVRKVLGDWYRTQARRRLPERVAIYAARAGLAQPPVLIRSQQKRWGSCSSKGELRFNWRIVMAPMPLIDYVVAHEVCHLEVRDHSPAFWKLLGTILPDYESRRGRLRKEGQRLCM